jgi:fructose-bisphosphate aldolase, class I
MTDFERQYQKMAQGRGFIAALDQSGGSTPKALRAYGIEEDAYRNEAEMFDLVHEMRTRLISNPAFTGDRILGAILFEETMDRTIEGRPTASYLWERKEIVPFLKIDQGMIEPQFGASLMKELPDLAATLSKAKEAGIFGTKMRSVIHSADEEGITAIADQQIRLAGEISAAGLVPIIEPEIAISAPDKAACEELLRDRLLERLDRLSTTQIVMLKLTLPEAAGFYVPLQEHPRVLRVVALSGGYDRAEANRRLAAQPGLIASFSRALAEGLSAGQSEEDFTAALEASIQSIYEASIT